MVYLTHKWKKNRKYLYLEKKARIAGKVKRIFQIYLGAEENIEQRNILLNVKKLDTRTYNFASSILWQMSEMIKLRDIINEFTDKTRNQGLSVGDYIVISIINRCIQASSKNALSDWLNDDFLFFQYPEYLEHLNSQGYWNHFQYFTTDILEKIQLAVTKKILEVFKIELDLILYDPTNFFTNQAIHKNRDQIAQFGNSKEKRFDKRIVNLSLLTTKTDAIPLWHQTYKGNTQDAKHFKSTIKKITDFLEFLRYDLNELTLVLDKGNHSSETIKFIEEKSLGLITAVKHSSHKNKLQIPNRQFQTIVLKNKKKVGYIKFKTKFHNMNGTLFVTYDRRIKKRSLAIFARDLKSIRKSLKEFLTDRLNNHKWTKKKIVREKLEDICGNKLFKIIFQFDIRIRKGKVEVCIREIRSEKAKYCHKMGKTTIFTNQTSWTANKVIQIYRDKNVIEDSFRQMKDPRTISIKPMYHHADLSIHIHVFTCVMAYLLNTLARKFLSDNDLDLTINQFQKSISKLKVTEIGRGQLKKPILQLNVVEGETKKISKIFDLNRIIKNITNQE